MSPRLSVVIATYNRGPSLRDLLVSLQSQDIGIEAFEVVLVDDGSSEPAWRFIGDLTFPYAFTHVRQENTGQAGARQHGVELAKGDIVVIIDDDMEVPPDFLRRHLEAHDAGLDVVLGHIMTPHDSDVRALHERFHMHHLEQQIEAFRAGTKAVRGVHLCTGNVSFRRALFNDVGGFDRSLKRSEDREIGIKFEKHGARIGFGFDAKSIHKSDHDSLDRWLDRAYKYGIFDRKIAKIHDEMEFADPWSFIFAISPLSRPLMFFSTASPTGGDKLARLAMKVADTCDRLGLERVALKGTTVVYGLEYFRGMRDDAGSFREVMNDLIHYVDKRVDAKKAGPLLVFLSSVKRDHEALTDARARYKHEQLGLGALPVNVVKKIGFQMMVATRLMRLLRDLKIPLGAEVASRLIRHVYAAEIHWDAELAPGVVVVHGNGLVISHGAKVKSGVILFHNVTLGETVDPATRVQGAPTLEEGVHIGPGATLLGPITIGRESKVMAGAVVTTSVPERSVVKTPPPIVEARARGGAVATARPRVAARVDGGEL
jgi:serine acetyltransferase/glycosyltransferase involved in cell wall biosynthesis